MSIKSRVVAVVGFLASVSVSWSQPEFLFEPVGASVSPGANVFFQCVAFGDGPITYQWLKDESPLPGETSDFLFLSDVSGGDAGNYAVVASTFSGSVTSSVVVLSLDATFLKVTAGPLVNDPGSSIWSIWGDYDNDGFPDVFVPKGSSDFNYLYHNNGDGTFNRVLSGSPVTDYANTRNAVWVDYDNDGWIDLFVANSGLGGGGGFGGPPGTNVLYRNNGDGTFGKATAWDIGADGGVATSAAWADYDRDGLLDLCVGININANFVYRNSGNGNFQRIVSGPIATESFKTTASLAWGDFNNDGAPDLIVANQPIGTFLPGNENLYLNNGDGTFTRQTNTVTTSAGNSVSCAWVDYDNDLDLDLFIVNYGGQSGALYRNDGEAGLTAITTGNLVSDGAEGGNSTSAAWADYDNDGWIDVFVTNDGGIGNFLYHNNRDGTFTRMEAGSPTSDRANSFGAAWADVNRDGFLDLFVSNVSGENYLYRNGTNSNGWISIRLVGEISNRFGVGAKVKVLANLDGEPVWQMREISARDGTGSPSTMDAQFGLGAATKIDTLRIEWPSGIAQEMQDVSINQFLSVVEPPSIRIDAGSVMEGDAGGRSLLLPVTLSQPTNVIVTVDFFTTDLLATAGEDYVATNGTIVFAPNQTTQTLAVTILGDLLDETNETFMVTLTNSTVLPILSRRAVATIIDDEPLTLAIADASGIEGNSTGGTIVFAVDLLKPVDYEVRVDYATVGVSAVSGVDFIATNGTVVFGAGETSKPVTIPIIGDLLNELNEMLRVNLTNVVNAMIADSQATGTIEDDDPQPTVTVANVSIVEGNSGVKSTAVNVNLSAPSGVNITVQYAFSNLTAQAGLDFLLGAGTVQFAPGVTNRTITVTTVGDTIVEFNETFLINLFNPSRVTIGNLGIVTILDDDLKVGSVAMTGSGFALSFSTMVGRNYRVEWTTELSASPDWTPLGGFVNVAGTGSIFNVVDPAALGVPKRFYRVVMLAP
jgi:hypothetical protein